MFSGGGQTSLSSFTELWSQNKIFQTNRKISCDRSIQLKSGFTLAEVLITLGIIGVVAAMTMPVLIQKNNNRIVETRLQKFYSAINQSIKMAEADYGDREFWFEDLYGLDEEGKSKQLGWCKKYIIPYMKVIKTSVDSGGIPTLYFADGSAVRMASSNGRDWIFYAGNPDRCNKLGNNNLWNYVGKCAFAFYYNPKDGNKRYGWNFEPYAAGWDGTENSLKRHSNYGCLNANSAWNVWHSYCTKWIQYNNWKIPDEYPFKVYYH